MLAYHRDMSNTLSANEVAAQLGCSTRLVYNLFRDGDLRGFRVKSNIRVLPESVQDYIARNSNTKPAQDEPRPVRGKTTRGQSKAGQRLSQKLLISW